MTASKIRKTDINRFELEIARKGCCNVLAPLYYTEDEEYYFIEYGRNSLSDLDEILSIETHDMFDAYRLLLNSLRTIFKSLVILEDYLIPSYHISLDPKEIYFTEERAVLHFSGSINEPEETIKELLRSVSRSHPETHADFLITKLPKHFDAKFLYKLFTSMEIDLHEM